MNFREAYYKRIGVDAGELRLKVDAILQHRVIDIQALARLTLHHGLQGLDRTRLWKLLLGIESSSADARDFVGQQLIEQYDDLNRAVCVLWPHVSRPSPEGGEDERAVLDRMANMIYLNEEGPLAIFTLKDDSVQLISGIIKVVADVSVVESEVFWIATAIHQLIADRPLTTKQLVQVVLAEDAELHTHLTALNVWAQTHFTTRWFNTAFSNVLHPEVLHRVWDRIIAGSSTVLLHVASHVMMKQRSTLLKSATSSAVIDILFVKPWAGRLNQDEIVSNAINAWRRASNIKDHD